MSKDLYVLKNAYNKVVKFDGLKLSRLVKVFTVVEMLGLRSLTDEEYQALKKAVILLAKERENV